MSTTIRPLFRDLAGKCYDDGRRLYEYGASRYACTNDYERAGWDEAAAAAHFGFDDNAPSLGLVFSDNEDGSIEDDAEWIRFGGSC